jgi:serine/threonine protein kinase
VTDEPWRRVKALFEAAVERPVDEREAFLNTAVGDDDALRREVESLLVSDVSDDNFLDQLARISEAVLADVVPAPLWSNAHPSQTSVFPGGRMGSYEIVALLGSGAMGEVWRARDTRLGRDVAIKILPRAFSSSPERVARFEREARVLASLNHAHIGAIYGREQTEDVDALVLELVEGETLADHLANGPLPVPDVLKIAIQITDALEAAHERGIIHRDLKPANIKIRPDGVVKVLDFGLAKAVVGDATGPNLTLSPVVSVGATHGGVLLGTAAYMSPEQARGQAVDGRTDVWAFGCVLYELLTGKRAFEGEDVSDTLVTVLRGEPNWTALPADLPAAIRTLMRRCLERDRKLRIADISNAHLVLADHASMPTTSGAQAESATHPWMSAWSRLAILGVGLLIGGAAVGTGVWLTRRTAAPRVMKTMLTTSGPASLTLSVSGHDLAVTPDGTRLVYVGDNGRQLFVRALDQLDPMSLGVTGRPEQPFTSPDGRWIGFFDVAGVRLSRRS